LSRETGIMSGLDTPRRSYAGGGNIGGGQFAGTPMGSRTGFQTTTGPRIPSISDLDKWKQRIRGSNVGGIWDAIKRKLGTSTTQSGSQIASDATKKVKGMSKIKNLLKSPKFSEKGLMELGKRYAPKALNVIKGGLSRFPLITTGVAGEYITRPRDVDKLVYEQEGYGPWEGRFRQILDPTYTKKWMKAAEEHYKDKDKVKDPEIPITESDIDTQVTGDVESDLMRAYKEYAPIFEKELGVSPDDTKKQLWMQLAKFGTGLMAQPGGDLVGAIGKAAEKPLEGAGETVKDVSTAKRQAKLLAMQTALRDVAPGDIAKKAKDVKKLLGLKGKEGDKQAFNIVNKWLSNDRTYRAEELKSYRKTAETLNVNAEGYLESMEELKEKHPKLVSKLGRTTKKLPDMEDLEDDAVKGEYYINDEGKIYRYNPDSDPPLLEPGDDGFEGSLEKKNKK